MDQTSLLTEIRDILRESAAEMRTYRTETAEQVKLSIAMQVSQARLYRRVVAVGAVIIVLLTVFVFSYFPRS